MATGFAVEDFFASAADGRHRAIREDDNATLHYTLRNRASTGQAATFLVSFLLGGEVSDVRSITLAPGANRSFTHAFGSVRGVTTIDAEVRAGNQAGRLHLAVTPWPRVGEPIDLGPFLFTVNGPGPSASAEGTGVSVTFSQRPLPEGDPHQTRVRMLCLDRTGRVSIIADTLPDMPGPDNSAELTLAFPACPNVAYGVEVTGMDAHWKEFYSRVLLVPSGWSPPQA